MTIATTLPSNIDPLATLYAMRISGSVTSADDCWAAAALDTRAEIARIIASASMMNGGSTQQHQPPPARGREEPPADLRADEQVHDQRVAGRSRRTR